MEGDVDKLVREGLVDPEWKSQPYNGMVTRSIVVLGTREEIRKEYGISTI